MSKYLPSTKALFRNRIINFFGTLLAVLLFAGATNAQNCSVNAGVPQTICANEQLFLQGSYTPPLKSGVQVLWQQIGGPAATIVDPTKLNTQVINILAGNSYTFRIYTTCADGALTYQDVTHTVKAISIASAGPDATYCPGAIAFLAGNTPGPGETGLWTGGGNGITINNPGSATSTITINGAYSGTATLRWTVTNSLSGCSSYDEVQITNRGGITPVNAGNDQTLSHCYSSTQSTNLNGSYAGSGIDGQIGTWSVVSGPNIPTITNTHSRNTSVTNLITGTYVFRWTVVGPCASGSDEVSFIVPAPTANITQAGVSGGNQIFCDPTTSSTVLYGATPLYINETVQWQIVSKSGGADPVIVSPNSPVTSITGLTSPNSYTFSYTINNGVTTCTSSANVNVSYLPNPPSLNITTTDPILLACGASSTTVSFTQGGSGTTQYRILSGPGAGYPSPWTNVGGSPLTISDLTDVGTYVVQMRRSSTVGSAPACGTVYDEISIVTSLSSDAANAGTDQILNCNVTSTDLIGNVPSVGTGTWSQVSGPSAIILTSPHSPTLSIAGLLPDGLYVFRWLISGGPICTPSQDDVQVYTAGSSPVSANAGPDQSNICYNTPVYLNAAPPTYVFERGTWVVTPSAGVSFSDIHAPKAVVTGLAANTTYTFTWTVANGCGSVSDATTVSVINTQGPVVAVAGADQCLNSGTTNITLAGNNPSPGTGLWTKLSGPSATITNGTLSNTTVTGLTNGTYKFEWAVSSGGCSPTRDTVTVTIDTPIQTFNAGSDQQICGNTATLTTSLGANPTVGTGKWTQVSGNAATIANPNNYTTAITGLVSGTYVFRYTITNGGCSSYDDVTLYVSEPASPANIALASDGVCGASTVSLVADPITSGTGLWTIISGPNTPNIVSTGSSTTSVTGLITGTYIFKWTVSGGPFCASSSDDIAVTVTLNANAGADQSYCEAITAVNLSGTVASVGSWSQVSGPNTANITATSSSTATASGLVPGVYTFQYSISAPGCTSTDVMTVTLYTPPSIANAGIDQEQCNQAVFNLAATTPASGTGAWSKLSGPAGGAFGNVNSPTSTFTGAVPGVYVFQWTVSNGSCSNADQVRVTNYAAPSVANAGADQNVTCASSVTMAGNDPVNGLGTWTFVSKAGDGPNPTITNPILYNTTITGLGPKTDGSPETYTFRWTIGNGSVCSPTQDDVQVTVYQLPTTANAGTDQVLCNQTSVVLGATPVGTGSGTWSVTPSAGITFSDIHSETATASGLVAGTTYIFRWTSATAFCSSYDDVTVVNSALPTTADVSATVTSYCSLVPIELKGNTPVVGTGIWTQTTGNPLVILSPTSPNTSAIGGTIGNSYTFVWTISNGSCSSSSATVTVTMNNTPSIALAGSDQEICSPLATTSTTLAGNATGGGIETGLWSIVTNAGGSPTFADATSPTTTISGLVGGSPNIYELMWTHAQGSCTATDNMIIKVWAAPTTSSAGTDQTLCNVSTITLNGNTPTVGSGTWTRVSGPNNPTITNPNSPTTTVTGLTSGTYVFRWTISNGICSSSTDDVTVIIRPSISLSGPSSASVCVGGSQTLTVTASGGSGLYNYQWQYNNSGWTNVGNSSSFSTGALVGAGSYAYRVIVTDQVIADNGGCSNTSGTATVTVVADPTINTQPVNPTDICQGGSTGNITISASGGTPSLTYQWQYWNGSTWNNVVNGTPVGATYSNPTSSTAFQIRTISLAGAYQYRCLVSATGNDCNQAISNSITLNVIPDPTLTNPVFTNSSICAGGTTTVSSTISGGTGTATYQWQYFNGSSWGNVVNGTPSGATYLNATTTTMTITGTTASGNFQYRLTTNNSSGCNFNSTGVSYAVVADPSITAQPASPSSICVGGTSANMSVGATGGTPSLDYQWQYNNSGTWGAVVDGTPTGAVYTNSTVASNFSVSGISVAGAYQYRCQVTATGDGCGVTNTTAITLNVIADPSISGVSSDATICQGGTYGLSVTASGGTPSLNYQWQSSTAGTGGPWTNVGANTSTYTTAALNQDTYYQVQISATGNDCNTITSTAVTVTVNNFISANTINSNQTICSGTSASLTGNDVSADGTVTYQWQYKTSLAGSYVNVPSGGTNRDYATPALTTNTWYQRIATSTLNGVACTLASNEIKVTVPSITTQPVGNAVSCEGASYSMTVAVDFGTASPTYQWQYTDFDCVSGWADIVGANSSTYTASSANLPQLGGTRNFRCVISISGSPSCSPALITNCAPVTVSGCNPKIGLAKQLVSMDNNGDGTYEALFNLRVQNYGGIQLDNIQVTDNLNTTFGAGNYSVLGISSANFAVNTLFNGNSNQNLLVAAGNSLAKNASSDIRLRVKILSAGSYTNTATASSSTGSVSDTSTDGSDPDLDHDGDLAEHSVPTPVVTACSPVMTASIPNGQMCYPTATTYTLNATATDYSSLSWTTDGTGGFNDATILNPIYTPSASDVQDGQVILKLTAKSGGVCPNVEAQMILTIWTPPTVDAGPNTTICSGSTHILTGAVAYNYTSLTWTTSGSGTFNNPNALNPTYTPSAADRAAGSVTLTVTATAKGTCSNVSDNMVLTFTAAPTVNAGIDASICSTSSTYTLGGSATNYSSVLWTTNGTGTFSNAAILNPVYTPSAADVATGQVQITLTATGNGSCGTVSDFMVLNIWPAPTVDAGPTTASICQGNSLILSGATAANYATLTWTVSGGTGTFDNANALNPTFTPTSGGTLTLTLTATSLNGVCSNASNPLTLTVNAAPTVSAVVNSNTTCHNSAGSVTLSSSGVTGTFVLNGVSQSGTTATYNNLPAGNYVATFTSLTTGCSATTNFQITNSNSNLSGTVTVSDVVCNGGTGSVLVNATGGTTSGGTVTATDGYRYSLDGGAAQASNSFSSLAVGNHTVKITDDNSCVYSIDFDVDQPTRLVAEITGSKDVSCSSGADGKATVNASGGTTPYTYLWNNGQTTATATGLVAGLYTATVTDAKGCIQTATVTIAQPALLTVSALPVNVTCNGGSNGSLTAIVSGGTQPYIIQWSNGSSAFVNSGLRAGSYNITVWDVNGCTVTGGPYTITEPVATTLTASPIVNTTCSAATGSVVLTSSDGSSVTLNGVTRASGSTFSGLAAGYYTATSNGTCPVSTSFRISNTTSSLSATISSVTSPLCHNGTGSAAVAGSGGTGALNYSLDGGTPQASGSFAGVSVGNHTVKVSDTNGCTYTVSFDINNPAALALSLAGKTDVSCFGASTGSAIVVASGGTSGYTYSVDAGGPNTPIVSSNFISGMIAGTYTVRVTDANGCTTTIPVVINQPAAALNITSTAAILTNPGCYGASTGSINITVSGGKTPYIFAWSNGFNSEDLTNVPAGSYTVNVSDANGCTITGGAYTLSNPDAVTLTASSIINTNCNASVGSVVLTSSDGSSITLNGVTQASGSTFSGLSAGYHTATSNGTCQATTSFNIINTNSTLAATVSFADVLCFGVTTTATVTATGGTGAKTYLLDGITSNGTGVFAGLSAGTHVVKITDANGCSYAVDFDIDQPTPLALALASKNDVSCQSLSDGSAIILASGGTTGYIYSIVSQPSGGNTVISANVISGMKAGNYTLRVTDANNCTTDLNVTISESACHPVAVDDNRTTPENTPVSGNVLANDTDPNGLSLTVTQYEIGGANYLAGTTTTITNVGAIVINTNGTYTFTPVANYNGAIPQVTYTITNGTNTDTASLNISVLPVDVNPTANADTNTTPEDTPVSGNVAVNDVMSSDGGNVWSLSGTNGGATHGTITMGANGNYSYSPAANFVGTDTVTYSLCDVDGDCSTTTLVITITAVNDAPVAVNDIKTIPEDTPAIGNVLANDTDIDGGTLSVTTFTVAGVTYPAGTTVTISNVGTIVVNANGTYTYNPTPNYNGPVPTVEYAITDGNGGTNTATLSITILPVDVNPTANADTKTTPEDIPVSGNVAVNDVMSSDGGNVWSLSGTNGGATHGTITMDANGNYSYSPAANFVGTDTVTYNLCDVDGDCSTTTLVITITAVNDAPVAVNDIKTTPEDSPAIGNVLANDTDIDGGTLSVTTFTVAGVTYPAGTTVTISNVGTIVVNANGTYTYNPTPNYNGPVPTVEYAITDGNGGTDTATLSITILPLNNVPVTTEDNYADVKEDTPYIANLGSNDLPSGDGANVWSVVSNPQHGTVDVRVDGTFTYTPSANYNGPDSFFYKLCDTNGDCSSSTVYLTVNPVNDAPVANDDAAVTTEEIPVTFNILTNDNDLLDGGTLNPATIDLDPNTTGQQTVLTIPGEGTYTVSTTTGEVTFTPIPNFNGNTSPVNYQVCDNGNPLPALCAQAQFRIKVSPANDPPIAGISSMATQKNPGGNLSISVFANKFSGTDIDGTIASIKITTMPTNATSITVDGITYTTIPSGGIIVNTNATGQPLYNIAIDPIDNVTESVVSYYVIDNEGLSSVLPGSVTVPFVGISVSGNVYSDTNGLSDNTVNGTGTNGGGTLYMNLVNSLNQVVASKPIAADGTYSFTENDGLTLNSSYNLILTNGPVVSGTTLSHATYPSGIVSVGENIGAGAGSDHTVDGILAVNTWSGSLTNANFGVDLASMVICPAGPFVISNTLGKCGYVVPGTAFDANISNKNGSVVLTHNYGAWGNPYSLAGATFPIGTTVVTWTARDAFGNENSCSISITVNDREVPTFVNCSSGVTFTISLSPDVCETGAIWSRPVAIDNNCSPINLVQTKGPAQGAKLEVGTYEIEYTATDQSGNHSSCSFFVKVIDTEKPRVVCRPDFEVPADKGSCDWISTQNSLSPLLTSSNCSAVVVWNITDPDGVVRRNGVSDASGQVFKKGTSIVKYRIQEDASQQSWDCSFKVTVVDREAPEITCPASIVQLANTNGCDALITLTEPSYKDCSPRKSVSYSVINPDNSQTAQLFAASYTFKPGISRVIWTVTDEAGNSSTCMQQVTVNADSSIIKPYAGSDANICEGSTFALASSGAAYFKAIEWTTDGSGKFSDAGSLHPVYTPSKADIVNGQVILKMTASSGCASASSIMTLTISKNAVIKAGQNKDVYTCAASDFAITGASQLNATSLKWSTSGTGTFGDASSLNTVYHPSAADLSAGTVTLTLTGESSSPCGKGSDSVILHLIPQSKADAGTDATICEGEPIVLSTSSVSSSKTILWKTSGSGVFSDAAMLHPTYIPSAADIVNGKVILTLSATSEYPCGASQDEMVLTISKLPKVNTGANIAVCSGELVKVNTATAENCLTVLWTTNGKGTITGGNTLKPTYKPAADEFGKLRFILTGNGSGSCSSGIARDTLYVTYYESLSVEMMKPDTILYNTPATLWVTANNGSGNYVYNWAPTNLVPNYNANRTETLPLKENTLFTVTISDLHTGCSITEQAMIVVEKQVDNLLEFYNGLTPNGDGQNDTWWIDGIEKFPDNEVLIFNRWGDKIIELRNYDNVNVVWDGKNTRGTRVPDGTYYYLVTIKNVKSYTGWMELKSGMK